MVAFQSLLQNPDIEHTEFATVLSRHFGSVTCNEESGTSIYRRSRADTFLEIKVTSKGKILTVVPSADFPKSELVEIEHKVREALIVSTADAIGQELFFSSRIVSGRYRYKQLFQIVPMPPDAPQPPDCQSNTEYPFILQFQYVSSSDIDVDWERRRKQAFFYARLLNLLLTSQITVRTNFARMAWVHQHSEGMERRSEWKQLGYVTPSLKSKLTMFSDTSDVPAIDRVEDDTYYQWRSDTVTPDFTKSFSCPLKIPRTLDSLLDLATELTGDNRAMFNRAIIAYSSALGCRDHSHSLSFVGLTAAIESLIPKETPCPGCRLQISTTLERCSECGQTKFGATKAFQSFIDRLIPDWGLDAKAVGEFYRVRSDIAHGYISLWGDTFPGGSWPLTLEVDEKKLWLFDFVVKTAVRRWLISITT